MLIDANGLINAVRALKISLFCLFAINDVLMPRNYLFFAV